MQFVRVIVCVLIMQPAWAQPALQKKTDSVTRLIQQYYNQKDISSLYALSGYKFKAAIDPGKFSEVTQGLYQQAGQLGSYEFESDDNKVAKYKATFTNVILSLLVGLDSLNKLETFALRPYEPDVPPKAGGVSFYNPLHTALDKKVDSVVTPFIKKGNTIGIAVGIFENGQSHVYGYGETAKDNQLIPDGNSLFEIGSITKTFTATLLAWFVQQGKIHPDDPVNKYLPDSVVNLQYNGKQVTIRSLANHSSGLPRLPGDLLSKSDPANPYRNYDDSRMFSFLAHFKPFREPGTQYEYSNLAMGLLGVILERISGKPYEQLLKEIICDPLQMKNTRIALQNEDSSKLALGYNLQLQPAHSWEFQALSGAGAIRSSINDMLLYARAQVSQGNDALQKAIQLTHQLTFEYGQNKVGLGWHIFTIDGKNYLAHDGQTGGYCSSMIFNPSSGKAVVILTNASVAPGQLSVNLIKWLDQN
jgi:CubicO group peptidase (beta-lactamase class C family)